MSSMFSSPGNTAYQQCRRCGKPLGPNEVQCGNCGFINAPQQPFAPSASGALGGTTVPQTPSPSGQQWGQPPAQPQSARSQFGPQVPFGPSGPLFGSAPQPGIASSGAVQQPFTPAPPSQPLAAPGTLGAFQQGMSNPTLFQSPGTQPPSQPLSPPSQFGMSQQGTQPPSQPLPPAGWGNGTGNLNGFSANGMPRAAQQFAPGGFQQVPGFAAAPPGWEQMPGRPAASTTFDEDDEPRGKPRIGLIIGLLALVVVVLAASVGGYFYVKPRLFAAPTPVPTPTPLPLPTGTPLFADQFTNNNSGWDLTSKAGQFSVKVGNGSMVLEDDNNRLLWELIPGGKNFSDFYLTVDANLSKGTQNNGYGFYIRGTANPNLDIATYYRFEIYGDGTFAIFKGTADSSGASNSQTLVTYTASPAINLAGKVNHISISAKGPVMTFYVNGQKLKIVTDNTYASGAIALFVSNLPNSPGGAAVTLTNLAVYPPQSWA